MNRIIILLISLCMFSSCHFSKGVKKDLNTGLSATYNGFEVDDIYLSDGNGTRLSNNKVTLGIPVKIVASGVKNFRLKEQNAYPGCTIILTDKNKKELLNLPDAFEGQEGLAATQATELKATLNTGEPMVAGETYHLYVRFYDKESSENEIVSQVDIMVQ
ncbi:MAG: hypothetical protein B6D37_01020 [Sphingobacteriales bacterium UTBCD1]|nr:MAG: hypothetical protein B6D37_01020 [Sphingobacteriales bacterium UTBCD1]